MPFHLTRVAFGCKTIEDIADACDRFAITLPDGTRVGRISSRRTPRRNLGGGSLYWILAHMLVARQAIIGIEEHGRGEGCDIHLSLDLVPIAPTAFRSHQGWRYLPADRAPPDLPSGLMCGAEAMPLSLRRELATLGLS